MRRPNQQMHRILHPQWVRNGDLDRWGKKMKTILTILMLASVVFNTHAQETDAPKTNEVAVLTSRGFRLVIPSQAQTQTLDRASENLKLVKQAKAQTRRIDQAVVYLWENINIAVITTPRVCTEYRGFFWFSRLDTAAKDDETFKSGFAVKKGTGEIYRWEDTQPQPPPGN